MAICSECYCRTICKNREKFEELSQQLDSLAKENLDNKNGITVKENTLNCSYYLDSEWIESNY